MSGSERRLARSLATCQRKVSYPSWDEANDAALVVARENPSDDANPGAPYPCSLDGTQHYHFGHLRFGDSMREDR